MRKANVAVWAYCLMPNHVHLILCPSTEDGLAQALGAAHRRWANFVNARGRWRGHLFDGRFASVAMDEAHLMSAVRYVALNPVRAGLAARAEDWSWSSTRAHLKGEDDGLVTVGPVLERTTSFAELISSDDAPGALAAIRAAETTGRPLVFLTSGDGGIRRRPGTQARPPHRPPRPGPKADTEARSPAKLILMVSGWGMVLLSPYSPVPVFDRAAASRPDRMCRAGGDPAAETTGRPLGAAAFVADLERRLGRPIARRAPGRKPTPKPEAQPSLF